MEKKLFSLRFFFKITHSIQLWPHGIWLKVRVAQLMALRVLVQSHLGWPWECHKSPDTSFGTILDEYALQDGWHPSCYRLYVGDVPVARSMKLCDVTGGSTGMILCHVATPRDSAVQRIREHMQVVAAQVQEDVTKGDFFRHLLF
jgi:hypothetical protein